MRILLIDSSPFFGGAQQSLNDTVSALCQALEGDEANRLFLIAADSCLIAQVPVGCSVFQIHTRHWTASPVGMAQYVVDLCRTHWKIARILREFQPDVILANGLRSALLLLTLRRFPHLFLFERDLRAPGIVRRLVAKSLRPVVLGLSQAVLAPWRHLVGENRCHLIPNGFPLDKIRQVNPVPLPPRTVLLVADLVPWKRHLFFAEAFGILKRRGVNCHPVVCARSRRNVGYENVVLPLLKRQGIQVVLGENALPYIAGASLLVCCSDGEPFGRTVIEALALEKRVVATPHACAVELQRLPGVSVSPEDTPSSLADAMQRTLFFDEKAECDLSIFSLAAHATAIMRCFLEYCGMLM